MSALVVRGPSPPLVDLASLDPFHMSRQAIFQSNAKWLQRAYVERARLWRDEAELPPWPKRRTKRKLPPGVLDVADHEAG